MPYKHSEQTGSIINAFYHVYNKLGHGFLEKVYENALAHELRKRGHRIQQQHAIAVCYEGITVGDYFADLWVDETVILEIKAAERISPAHEAQLLNYLKATHIDVGLILNFGPKPEVKRKIFETARR